MIEQLVLLHLITTLFRVKTVVENKYSEPPMGWTYRANGDSFFLYTRSQSEDTEVECHTTQHWPVVMNRTRLMWLRIWSIDGICYTLFTVRVTFAGTVLEVINLNIHWPETRKFQAATAYPTALSCRKFIDL